VRTRVLSMFGRVGLKNTFLFRETGVRSCSSAYDFTPENWIISCRFSLWKYSVRRQDKQDIHPIRYLIHRFICEKHQ